MDFTSDQQAIIEEFKRRQRALQDLEAFRAYMAPSGLNDFAFPHAEHHQLIAHDLEWALNTPRAKLMIVVPWASGKTVVTSVQFAAFAMAKNPKWSILCSGNTQDFTESLARRRRDALDTQQFYQLTGAKVRQDTRAAKEFHLDTGGVFRAVGVDGSCIGFRSDLNILDDPHKSFEDLFQMKYRDDLHRWYTGPFRSRLSPEGREIIITTRFHADDLAGRLLKTEQDDWRVLHIPELSLGPGDPLGRPEGQRLWPEYLSEERLKVRERDPQLFSCAYMGMPYQSEGEFFSPEDFEIVDHLPEGLASYGSIDLALEAKEQADATVILSAGFSNDGILYIKHMAKNRCSPEQTLERLSELHKRHNYREMLIEDSPAEKVFKDLAAKYFREARHYLPLMPMPTRGKDKHARAQSARGMAKMGAIKLLRGPWNDDFLREVSEFGAGGRHDDVIDALATLAQRASKMTGAPQTTPMEEKPIKTLIQQDKNGRQFLTPTLNDLWADRHDELLSASRRRRI